ncbi:hypothetical protein ACF1AJ_19435 [Leifsonia sp. NPDC014704]|uniref:hypothetical protein n=1 Tax=Leifsonia sp. NPDC014704 TaxID=3364123 RepID=UPI0036F44F99
MALVAFPPAAADVPLIHAALGGPPPARWINPDHITSLIPVTRQGENDVELVVDYKLQGLPEGRWHLGRYPDVDQAHAAWGQLIQHIAAHSNDPRRQ